MSTSSSGSEVKLRRVLKLRDLIIYGIVLIQPGASLSLFGHASDISKGHAVTTILIAMVAMVFTSFAYGRMAYRHPEAGSAYAYVGRGLNPHLGFVAGWSMFLDYLIVPIICNIYVSIAAHHLLPMIPFRIWVVFFVTATTYLNLYGIKLTSRVNFGLLLFMSAVVFYFMAAAVRYVFMKEGIDGLFSLEPFYQANTFTWGAVGAGTAFMALTFIGFDGLTTLAEEVENPRRNVMLATVFTCVITGIWSGSQIYLAQLSWPDWMSFTRGITDELVRNNALDTAIMAVAARVGGHFLDIVLSILLMVASIGSTITGQAGLARLLYGMGRDRILPKKFFAHLDGKYAGPSYNVLLIGVLTLIGANLLKFEECGRLINFGAFLAFMGVNLASINACFFKAERRDLKTFVTGVLPGAFGFVFCLVIWSSLPLKTFVVGGSWMLLGIVYLVVKTGGFREEAVKIDFTEA
ncbi:APC family permease [candidate division KSB1 bacterium]